jgi:hypothetical protein
MIEEIVGEADMLVEELLATLTDKILLDDDDLDDNGIENRINEGGEIDDKTTEDNVIIDCEALALDKSAREEVLDADTNAGSWDTEAARLEEIVIELTTLEIKVV